MAGCLQELRLVGLEVGGIGTWLGLQMFSPASWFLQQYCWLKHPAPKAPVLAKFFPPRTDSNISRSILAPELWARAQDFFFRGSTKHLRILVNFIEIIWEYLNDGHSLESIIIYDGQTLKLSNKKTWHDDMQKQKRSQTSLMFMIHDMYQKLVMSLHLPTACHDLISATHR